MNDEKCINGDLKPTVALSCQPEYPCEEWDVQEGEELVGGFVGEGRSAEKYPPLMPINRIQFMRRQQRDIDEK